MSEDWKPLSPEDRARLLGGTWMGEEPTLEERKAKVARNFAPEPPAPVTEEKRAANLARATAAMTEGFERRSK